MLNEKTDAEIQAEIDSHLIQSTCYPDRQYSFNEVFTENLKNHRHAIAEHAKRVLTEKQNQIAILGSYYNSNIRTACG